MAKIMGARCGGRAAFGLQSSYCKWAKYDYIDIVQWTTGDAQRRASMRPIYQELEKKMQGERLPYPMMFSSVVDDTKKTPT
ncbi:unnamed protein product [Symbiodinium natans]|uniref:Uncharacterized protein n=1 Tax=Symbiodinium natans TaxID=878477 RepID=A0A812UJ05_9DINO|nr:unnamed protein product [Symbiodinium natans]